MSLFCSSASIQNLGKNFSRSSTMPLNSIITQTSRRNLSTQSLNSSLKRLISSSSTSSTSTSSRCGISSSIWSNPIDQCNCSRCKAQTIIQPRSASLSNLLSNNSQSIRHFAADLSNPVHKKIDELIKSHDIFLFMKGSPIFPQCGFSRTVCEVLKREGFDVGKYESMNILEEENQSIREGVKEFSDWPTIPQLYVKGEFVGGCDIVVEMHRDGELKKVLEGVKKE